MNHSAGSFDNPFATRWVSPGALPYLFPPNQSVDSLLEQFYKQQCRGSIIGPHGCGKSTLLATLIPHLRKEAADLEFIVLRSKQRKLPNRVSGIWRAGETDSSALSLDPKTSAIDPVASSSKRLSQIPKTPTPPFLESWASPENGGGETGIGSKKNLLIVDGWEQLRPWTRVSIDRRCRRVGWGLLVTCHKPLRLPVLARVSPDLAIVRTIVTRLMQKWDTDIPVDVIDASFRVHRGNCREMLFDLYDWYERSNWKHRSK